MTTIPKSARPKPVSTPRGEARLWRRSLGTAELARHIAYCRAALDTAQRGRRLEQLATWLFPHLPGLSVDGTNVFSAGRSHEVDVPMFNDVAVPGALAALGTTVYVECKNYNHPVGGQEVAWFHHKLVQGGSTAGVLLAAEGVTGDPRERTFAQGVIQEARTGQTTRWILVITLDDIAAVTTTHDIRQLLKRKLMDNSTGRPV